MLIGIKLDSEWIMGLVVGGRFMKPIVVDPFFEIVHCHRPNAAVLALLGLGGFFMCVSANEKLRGEKSANMAPQCW